MSKQEIAKHLDQVDFFGRLKSYHIDFLAECAKKRSVKADEVLFHYDQPADRFFLVTSGKIRLEVAAIEGPSLELQDADAGAILGWSWLIPPYRWSFQGRAVEDSELYEFDGKRIRERCEEDHEFGYAIMSLFSGLMSERLAFARQRMIDEWQVSGFA